VERFPLPTSAAYSYTRNFSSRHMGTDIMAPAGTPVLAVENGKAWSNIEPKGGRVAYLQGASGARYFYGHLSEWTLKLISATAEKPLLVHAGDELGKVGTSGNAEGREPHLHFQIRRGSAVTDPFNELAQVDENDRGTDVASNMGTGLLVLAVLWFLSGSKWGRA
jgi:murein DD-endopeptidase MepM/ murein hydrolase activator NlpD